MTDRGKPLAIIPARGGSKRLARKNVALLRGRPLIAYTVEAALQSGVFGRVVVSTEDEDIAAHARAAGATIDALRPATLASDQATVVDVCLYEIDSAAQRGDPVLDVGVLLPTSPLRNAADIRNAYDLFRGSEADVVMAVTDFEIPPFWALTERNGYLAPFWGEEYLKRADNFPPVCVDNGAIYFSTVDSLRSRQTFYVDRLVGFPMPRHRSVDVDTEEDLLRADFFFARAYPDHTR